MDTDQRKEQLLDDLLKAETKAEIDRIEAKLKVLSKQQ